jgi:hypothetical protein
MGALNTTSYWKSGAELLYADAPLWILQGGAKVRNQSSNPLNHANI